MLLANTAKGFPAVLVVVGTIVGIVGIWWFATGRPSEMGSKLIAAGLGLTAVGLVLAQF
ncbi:MAG: hypothetical protein JWN67_541 [Actinomycetia bacterium]|nr:hypothetical protein [Actinomycetes bacterium]